MLKNLATIFTLFLLTACSSYNAGVVFHDSFDFSAVKSYSLYGRNSAFTETQALLDSHRNAIEIAIERSMAKNKFSYAELEQADLIVTYYVLNGKRNDFSKYNKQVQFCQHCLRATAWNTDNKYSMSMHDGLIVDLLDPKNQRSVWRSSYSLDYDGKDNSAEANEKIQQAVASMLAQYPQTAKAQVR